MTTSIGSVTLDRDMFWEDEFNYAQIASSVERTLGGGIIVQEFQLLEVGQNITLVSTETQGLQQRSTVAALMALAATPNQTFTLTISSNSQTVTKIVRFRHEVEPSPIQFQPCHPRDGLHSDTIYYKGAIYLMIV